MAKNTDKNAKEYNVKARENYRKNKLKTVLISFNVETEQDLIDHLEMQKNRTGYIKDLIRKDMS